MAKITALLFIMPVRDLDVASRFYREAFDLEETFRNEGIAFVGIPGSDSAVGLLLDPEGAGSGPRHTGFHVDHALSHSEVVDHVEKCGGTVLERGHHAPDVPFARITDPDGNEFEI
jgi:catechol 2,3-dioxygenase-like lactoylglutathione lyase family enzyme